MKTIRFFLMLIVASVMVACSNDDEPALVADVEDVSSNELTGTRWIAHPDNSNLSSGCIYTSVAYIEFFGSKKCLINRSLDYYANDPTTLFYNSEYNDETNKGKLDYYNVDFIVIDNELFLTEIDFSGDSMIYKFTKDLNYVAPAKDCSLIGYWEGDVNDEDIPESWNPKVFLKIIDNNRLLYYSNFICDGGDKTILDYTFDGKTLSFISNQNDNQSFNLKGNKLVRGSDILTKK